MSIQATLTLNEAAANVWDVLVVGAGPAGAIAARETTRRGLRVLLVDKAQFPRWKVCGCCINRNTLSTLETVGLGEVTGDLGAVPLTAVRLAAEGQQAGVRLPAGVALSRKALDARLVKAAVEAGAAFLPGVNASLRECRGDRRFALLRHADEQGSPGPCGPDGQSAGPATRAGATQERCQVSARIILAADGLGGAFLAGDPSFQRSFDEVARIGAGVVAAAAPSDYQPGTIYMACSPNGYVGLVRLETGELDIAAAFDPVHVRESGGLGEAAASILAEARFPGIPDIDELPWRGTPLLRRRAQRPAAERVFALGDAARFVEPFTGDGIAWAVASGAAVAPLVQRGCRQWSPRLISDWSQLYRRTVGRRQRVSWVIAEIVRRPRWIRSAIRILARRPGLAWPLVRFLNAPSSPRRFTS